MTNSPCDVDRDVLDGEETILSDDELAALLGDALLRETLVYLAGRSTVEMDELAEATTGFQAVREGTIATSSEYDAIRLQLHHVTVPKLESMGYVRYGREDGTIRTESIPDGIHRLLGIEG